MTTKISWDEVPQDLRRKMSKAELQYVRDGLAEVARAPRGSDLRRKYEEGGLKAWLPAWVVLEMEEVIKPVFDRADLRGVLEQVRDSSVNNSSLSVGLISRRLGRSEVRVKMMLEHLWQRELIEWDSGFVWLTEAGAEELQRLCRRVDPSLLAQGSEGGGD